MLDEAQLPRLARLRLDRDAARQVLENQDPVWSVRVGPAHANIGGHGDHAFLAETAWHALLPKQSFVAGLALNYLSEVQVGDTLHAWGVHDDVVCLARRDAAGEVIPVVLAKREV